MVRRQSRRLLRMQMQIVYDLFAHSREAMYDLSEHLAIVYIMF